MFRQGVLFPFRVAYYLIVFPFTAVLMFFLTNWNKEWDRDSYKKILKNLLTF